MRKKVEQQQFKLVPVVTKGLLSKMDEAQEDLQYWLTRSAQERLAAVTFLVSQSIAVGERIDKSVVSKGKIKAA